MTKWDGHDRRLTTEQREGRRKSDERCPDHHLLWKHHDEDKKEFRDLSCGKIAALKVEMGKMMPRWVVLWVGVPSMVAMLGFVSWVSLKGISNTEAIIEMRSEQKATSANVVQLMKHFDLVPVQPIKK
jgi:hypothetical protein